VPALLVCSGSDEEEALHEVSDMVVPGPVGVLELLARLAQDAQGHRAG
jgi:trehalose 6-phosphate phosphatase